MQYFVNVFSHWYKTHVLLKPLCRVILDSKYLFLKCQMVDIVMFIFSFLRVVIRDVVVVVK